ncbi:MAG: hypothetical protein ABIK09_15290 [Pseudomonadota bacterium]
MYRSVAIALLLQLVAAPGLAAPGEATEVATPAAPQELKAATKRNALSVPLGGFVWLEPAGSFRWRLEVWRGMDLGLQPLANPFGVYRQVYDSGANPGQSGSSWRETSDLRLRLEPSLWIGDRAVIHTRIDVMDVVAGSGLGTSILEGGGVGTPSMGPSMSGSAGFVDSIAVRGVWLDLDLFSFIGLRLGRIPTQWGLGMLENSGDCAWCDKGDSFDTLGIRATPFDLATFEIDLDFPLEGTTGRAAMDWPFAPDVDRGDADDILQIRLKASSVQGPEPVPGTGFQWGGYARFRWQDYSTSGQDLQKPSCAPDGLGDLPYECVELFYKDALFITPDVWVQAGWNVGTGILYLAAEFAGHYGRFKATQATDKTDTGKEFLAGGGLVRLWWESERTRFAFEGGIASGDGDADAFGVYDGYVAAVPDLSHEDWGTVRRNDLVTAWMFNPAYLADSILFRHVVGAVTNAWYVKPTADVALWRTRDKGLAAVASVMYAGAVMPRQTPGGRAALGLETELGLRFRWDHVEASISGTGLVPFAGFDHGDGLPLPAWLLRTGLLVSF